jgi:amidase
MGLVCSIDMIYGDRWEMFLTTPAAASGYPHITVPWGRFMISPVGFHFGPAYSEPKLISIAYAMNKQQERT